jgi:branched-chain amino acid transport system permease protein
VGPFIVSGIVVGSIYAISALGLVLTYSSSRVFNFAHGAIAYFIAVFYYWLTRQEGWSVEAAAPFTILVVAPLIGLILYGAVFRRLTHLSPTVRLVATVGLWVAIPALVRIIWPFVRLEVLNPQGLVDNPVDLNFVKVFGTWLNTNQFAVIVSAAVIAIALSLVLRFTPWGLATRASVDQPVNASIAGINTEAVTAVAWMTGTMLAGFSGVLLAPIVGLLEFQFTLLLVGSFAAVVIARMTSLPIAFFGALAIGLMQQIWVKYQPESGFFSKGVSASIPFVVMLVFLIGYSFTTKGLRREAFAVDARRAVVKREAPPLPLAHGWRRALGPLVCAGVLVAIPVLFNDTTIFGVALDSFWLGVFTQGIALAIIFLSYTLVTGEGGMIALSQITFAGIGAFAAARLATEAGWPVWGAILVGACVAIPFGLLVALPSIRIGDLYLALLTIGFALLIEQLVWTRPEYDNFGAGVALARPFGLQITGESTFLVTLPDRTWLYLLMAVVFGALALLVINLKRSTTGLVFASIRSSETASATTGISIVRAKLIIFAVSAFVAGLGGALYASTVGSVTAGPFTVVIGIVWLAIVVTWGVRSVMGALLAGMIYAVAPQKLAIVLMLLLVVGIGALFANLLARNAHRHPAGWLAMALLVVFAVSASLWMWDEVDNTDAVNAILALIVLALAATLVLQLVRTSSVAPPLAIAAAVCVAIAGVVIVYLILTGGVDIDDQTAQEVPTLLFGLGAVALAREPRGVIYDMANSQRLRRLREAERRDEEGEMLLAANMQAAS